MNPSSVAPAFFITTPKGGVCSRGCLGNWLFAEFAVRKPVGPGAQKKNRAEMRRERKSEIIPAL